MFLRLMGDDLKTFSEAQAQRARDSWAKRRARQNPKGDPMFGRYSQMAAHNRWHVQCGIRSESCPLFKSLVTEAC